MLVAGVLGGLVGLDRELSDQPAGLRTHVLVSLGAALFTLSGAVVAAGSGVGQVDPTRVAAQVVTGIGFLGAGAIIRQGVNVRGITTAAGLWVTAAIGTAVGLGFWAGALATTFAAVFALIGLKRLERHLLRRLKPGRYEFVIDASLEFSISEATKLLEQKNCRIEAVSMDSMEGGRRSLIVALRLPPRMEPQMVADMLSGIDEVSSVDWTR